MSGARIWIFILVALAGAGAFGQDGSRELRGVVVDGAGRVVTNASIKVHAVTRATGTRYGENPGIEAGARTDGAGVFVIRGEEGFRAATLSVEAPGFARRVFAEVPTGGELFQLKLTEGVEVVGALLKDGQPVANARVAIDDFDGSEVFGVNLSAETDERGRFRISNVPARREFLFYARMDPSGERGELPARRMSTGLDRSTLDLGEIRLARGHEVEGSIRVAGGGESAGGVRVVLGRDGTRDTQETRTDETGRFRFRGVPGEVISLAAKIEGLRLSLRNGSLFAANPDRLLGRVTTNVTGLVMEFERGADLPALNNDSYMLRNEPLLGMEHPGATANSIAVQGRVVDAETGEPLPEITVMPGRYDTRGLVDWFVTRERAHTNGVFLTHVTPDVLRPAIFVGAEDHVPFVSQGIAGATNFAIALKRGIQARGFVVQPNGAPATNVAVYLMDTNASLRVEGTKVETSAGLPFGIRQGVTDHEGYFAFMPRGDESYLMVMNETGFGTARIEELRTNRNIQLRSWARVEGRVMAGASPASNAVVRLTSMPPPFEWYPRELPAYSLTMTVLADAEGNFVVEKAPPIMMEIGCVPGAPDGSGMARDFLFFSEAAAVTQARRAQLKAGETLRVELGGSGRVVTGRAVVPGLEEEIPWSKLPQTMATIEGGAPNPSTLTNLMHKLLETRRRSGAKAGEIEAAETAYQAERRKIALAVREYYASDRGLAELLSGRRYALQFGENGAFRIEDVPAGKYAIQWRVIMLDPTTGRIRIRIDSLTELTVPEAPAEKPREPFDLGTIQLQAIVRN